MAAIKVNMSTNSEVVGYATGAVEGIMRTLERSPRYMELLIRNSHDGVKVEFDRTMAATAGAGYLTHVYEFGVPGITRGPMRVADPMSDAAKLWVHQMTGSGKNLQAGYVFRPAKIPNPQPTTAYTGVPSKYLRKLSKRKYIFWNKAFVMESGQSVNIKAKNGSFLFVPFGRDSQNTGRNGQNFAMWHYPSKGPIKATPGASTRGSFNAFWETWWGSTGQKLIQEGVDAAVSVDVEAALALAAARSKRETPKPAQAASLEPDAKRVQRLTQRKMLRDANRRNNT